MRPKKRIYKLWKFFKIKKNVYNYFKKIHLLTDSNALEFTKIFLEEYKELKAYHFDNVDLRFTQVVQNKVAYFPGWSYYKEDSAILIALGCKPEESIMWGANYTKDMKKLKRTKWKYLCDLELDHIKAIVEGDFTQEPIILEYFNKRINEKNPR